MIKEFEKHIKDAEVQINLQHHEDGIKAKIVFIPTKKGPAILPIDVWGTSDEVLNSIRYHLSGIGKTPIKSIEMNSVEEKFPILTEVNPCQVGEKPLPRHDEVGELEPNTLVETQPPDKIPIVLEEPCEKCPKCTLPVDSVENGTCIYVDCPSGKSQAIEEDKEYENFVAENSQEECVAPKGTDSYMHNVFIPPRPAEQSPEDVPEWAENVKEEYDAKKDDNLKLF